MSTIGDFLRSQEYLDFIVNDDNFPVDEDSIEKIIEYLLTRHRPTLIDEDYQNAQSDIHWFAHTYHEFNKQVKASTKLNEDYNFSWDYPVAKQLLKFVEKDDKDEDYDDGVTHFNKEYDEYEEDDEHENWMMYLTENLKLWLSLLKISLTMDPFDESLKYDDDKLIIPRLTQDETELGFKFTGENAYENVKTREETILFIIQKMGQVFTERGNTEGYKKWIEFSRVHLQSVLKTPLVLT